MRQTYKKVKIDPKNKNKKDLYKQVKNESIKLAKETNPNWDEYKIRDEHVVDYIKDGTITIKDGYINFHTFFSAGDANVSQTTKDNVKKIGIDGIFSTLSRPEHGEVVFYENVLKELARQGVDKNSDLGDFWRAVYNESGSIGLLKAFVEWLANKGIIIPDNDDDNEQITKQSKAKTIKTKKPATKKSKAKPKVKTKKASKPKTKGSKSTKKELTTAQKEARNAKARAYYAANKEKIKQQQKARYEKNKAAILQRQRERYQQAKAKNQLQNKNRTYTNKPLNSEQLYKKSEYQKQYYRDHRKTILPKQRERQRQKQKEFYAKLPQDLKDFKWKQAYAKYKNKEPYPLTKEQKAKARARAYAKYLENKDELLKRMKEYYQWKRMVDKLKKESGVGQTKLIYDLKKKGNTANEKTKQNKPKAIEFESTRKRRRRGKGYKLEPEKADLPRAKRAKKKKDNSTKKD